MDPVGVHPLFFSLRDNGCGKAGGLFLAYTPRCGKVVGPGAEK